MKLFKNNSYISGLLKKWGNWKLTSVTGSGSGSYYWASRSNNGLEEEAAFRLLTLSKNDIEMCSGSFQNTLEQIKSDIKMTKMYQNLPNLVTYNEAAMFSKNDGAQVDVLLRMEPIESLSSLVQRKAVTGQAAVRVGVEIGNALANLEGLETAHLNLQPNSIVLGSNGEFKLIPPPLHGEPADPERVPFMAPELRAQGQKSSRADQYSLGMVLYWMLNGFTLPGDRMGASAFPPPSGADPRLAAIVLRACSLSPAARFSSAKELCRALEDYSRDPADITRQDTESGPEGGYTVAVPAMTLGSRTPERPMRAEEPKPQERVAKPGPAEDRTEWVKPPEQKKPAKWERAAEREEPIEPVKPPEQKKPAEWERAAEREEPIEPVKPPEQKKPAEWERAPEREDRTEWVKPPEQKKPAEWERAPEREDRTEWVKPPEQKKPAEWERAPEQEDRTEWVKPGDWVSPAEKQLFSGPDTFPLPEPEPPVKPGPPTKTEKSASKGSKKWLLIPIAAAVLLIAGLGLYFAMGRSRPAPAGPTEAPESRVTQTPRAVNRVQILSQPEDYTGALGEEFTFSVTVEGEGISYRWQCRSDANWADAELEGSDTATVSGKLSGELVGTQYRCRIEDASGTVMYSDTATLKTDAPYYVAAQPKDFTGRPGDAFELSVRAAGAKEYQWEYLRNTQWEDADMEGSDTDTIRGTAAEELLGRVFRCRMTGEDGNVFYSDEVALLDASETAFRMQPMDHVGELGERFAFAVGAPEAQSYEWQYLEGEEWLPTDLFGRNTGTITGVITEDLLGKVFRCAVTDAGGKTHYSREVSLSVSFAILQQPEKKFVGELGSTFTFHVTAVGAQSYQWQYQSGGNWLDATNLDGNQTDTASGKITGALVGTKYRCKIIDNKGNEHYSDEVLLAQSAPSGGGSQGTPSGGGSGGSSGGSSGGGSGGSSGGSSGGVVKLSLGGVEFDSDVTSLNLQKKGITDISVLAQCTELTWLNLNNNQISDLTPLKNLKKLESLFLNNNQITDISALAGLKNLKTLQLQKNNITDWSPVDFLTIVAGRP